MLGLVLVHGVRSSAAMWDSFAAVMSGDERLTGVASEPVSRFEYATGIWRRPWPRLRVIPSITTAADSLKEYLITEAGGFEHLVLVGHSQGGLVIERCLVRMLAEGRGLELARIRRVVLLATPNTGSQLLQTTRRMLVHGNPQERELRPFEELVADTLRALQRDVVNAAAVPTERSCRIPFSVFAGEQDGVVTRASAQAVFPDAAVLPGDHFSIAKPDSPRHRTYTTVLRLLLDAAIDSDSDPPRDTVTALGPSRLEVHNAVDPNVAHRGQVPGLTAYLPRKHDQQVRTVIGEVFAGGQSRLLMLTGESSTGKTRALYEALVDVAPNAPLLCPGDAADLRALLGGDRLRPGSVLWLNEAQRFLYGSDGSDAAVRLRTVLSGTAGIVAVGTLWTSQYWNELTAPVSPGNSHGQAKALLTHPLLAVRINVPSRLDGDDLNAWRDHAKATDDRRLQQALLAGSSDGRVVQHLSGGPELLAAYLAGPGELFTAREHALVTAALDARRLGHRGPLPAVLLAQASDGDLHARHRSPDHDWAGRELQALTSGQRGDGTRTDIRGTLTALTAVYARSGSPAAYEPADYLDQQVRHIRAERYGTLALWTALIDHTVDADDSDRLAHAAWSRGLRTTAVRLWHKAVAAGYPTTGLVRLGDKLDPGRQAAAYTATHVGLTDPTAVAELLRELRSAGADQAVASLPDHDPAALNITHLGLTDLYAAAERWRELRRAGAAQAQALLLDRDPAAHADITDPYAVARLLSELREAGAEQAVTSLLGRDPATHADITELEGVAELLRELRREGAHHAIDVLAHRVVAHPDLTDIYVAAAVVRDLWEAGAEQVAEDLAHRAATEPDAIDPDAMAYLLCTLRETGAEQAVTALLDRDPAAQVVLTDSRAVAELLREFGMVGADQAVTALAHRAVAHANATDPNTLAHLLPALQKVGADHAVTILLDRYAAVGPDITEPHAITTLLRVLQKAGAEQAVAALLDRDPAAQVVLTDSRAVAELLREFRMVGAELAVRALTRRAAMHVDIADSGAAEDLLSAMWEAETGSVLTRRVVGCRFMHRHSEAEVRRALRAQWGTATEWAATEVPHGDPAAPGSASATLDVQAHAEAKRTVMILAHRAAAHTGLTDPYGVAVLLRTLKEIGAEQAMMELLDRDPAVHVDLADAIAVAGLLETLQDVGAEQAVTALAHRAATGADINDPKAVAHVLEILWEVGAEGAVQELLDRDPAIHVYLADAGMVTRLLQALVDAGADAAGAVLKSRAVNAGLYPDQFAPYGREPDGRPSAPWTANTGVHISGTSLMPGS